MILTLTHLDSARGARDVIPTPDPATGVVVFTGRPGKSGDRTFGVTQDLLSGFGVRPDVSGAGRRVADNALRIRARLRAYSTRMVVVRHADMLHRHGATDAIDLLRDICAAEGVALALTCDDTSGQVLAEWLDANGGHVNDEADELLSLLPSRSGASDQPPEDYPASVPSGDFYIFRARCRELLNSADFGRVDAVYIATATEVLADPFGTDQEAAERLQRACAKSDSPAHATTVLRAAQAAMFRCGVLLKVHPPAFMRLVEDRQHRRLNERELNALRAYGSSTYASGTVLLDAGLPAEEVVAVRVGAVGLDGAVDGCPGLLPEARRLLAVHRHHHDLDGTDAAMPLLSGMRSSRLISSRRLVATELGLPGMQSNAATRAGTAHRWSLGLGVTMLPLTTQHLPSPEAIKGSTAKAAS